jgi:hypothetical protein
MNHIVGDKGPDVLILNAGARLPMMPIDEQSWEEFSAPWNTDVRAGYGARSSGSGHARRDRGIPIS